MSVPVREVELYYGNCIMLNCGRNWGSKVWILDMEVQRKSYQSTNLLSQVLLTLRVDPPRNSSWGDLWKVVNSVWLPPQWVHSYTFSGKPGPTVGQQDSSWEEERKDKLQPTGYLCICLQWHLTTTWPSESQGCCFAFNFPCLHIFPFLPTLN